MFKFNLTIQGGNAIFLKHILIISQDESRLSDKFNMTGGCSHRGGPFAKIKFSSKTESCYKVDRPELS